MSEREEHNELIHRLAERLRNHTEPYKDGAWERFAATHGKRRRRLWPYSSAAAVLLAAVGWYWSTWYVNETPRPSQSQIVQQDMVVAQPVDSAATAPPEMPPTQRPATAPPQRLDGAQRLQAGTSGVVRKEAQANEEALVNEETLVNETEADPSGGVDGQANKPTVLADVAVDTATAANPASNQLAVAVASGVNTDTYTRTSPKSDSGMEKWDVGLVVSPSLTSEAVNIGGGFAVAYRISDKFSIGSGISVAQLGVGENPNYQPDYSNQQPNDISAGGPYFNGKSEMALAYNREVSLTSSVVTLDIPVDIRYDVAKGFYTSVGLSYVAVLDERRTGHYVDRLNKNTFANSQLSTADRLASTEFVYSSEKIAAKPLQGNGYAGFMNFSIGKKLPISGKLFLSVEPYFKLPIGRLSKEEMNFTNGGIRIVTGF